MGAFGGRRGLRSREWNGTLRGPNGVAEHERRARVEANDLGATTSAQRPMVPMIIRVKVKPRARESSLAQTSDGTWLARVRARPIEGRANHELIALVAQHFGCAKQAVSIKSGESGRLKLVRIQTTRFPG